MVSYQRADVRVKEEMQAQPRPPKADDAALSVDQDWKEPTVPVHFTNSRKRSIHPPNLTAATSLSYTMLHL
jgi:hypothetical protein